MTGREDVFSTMEQLTQSKRPSKTRFEQHKQGGPEWSTMNEGIILWSQLLF
tara:strand:+ start:3151 stop:3303 length:153 start_codon:yes stop_codon:yes gene_type:complete